MNVLFSNEGWEDYQYWQANDIKLLKKINDIIKDIKRNSNQGIGQPEKLKGNIKGKLKHKRYSVLMATSNNKIIN